MRIQHNIAAMNSYRNFGINNTKMSKNLEKLSSGYAVNRAGDDAAGLAVSEKMRAQITGLEAATKNAKDAIGLVQTAEGALTEVHDMLNRMEYLAKQAENGTYTTQDRSNLNEEVNALKAEIDRIGKSSNFNKLKLFDATGTSINMAIDEGDEQIEVSKHKLTATALALTGDITSATNAKSFRKNVDGAIKTISTWRSGYGAAQNRLEHTVNNLGVMRENIQDAESRIRDTDVAEEMMKFTKNSIMNQASQAMLAQANQLPQGVLQLLQ